MAQPYLIAMNHSEWHAKNVLKKFHRNRPLGEIELQHRYKPTQPVLSCRTVDIDSCGTRTYRAKNTIDIIEEQHKLIHEIYTKARNISSAPSGGQRTRPKVVTQEQVKGLQALRVCGSNVGVSQSRPSSGKTEFIVLKTRPSTTGSHRRRAIPTVDTELKLESDPDIDSSAELCNSTRQQIHNIWEPEQRTLDEGKFVRGRKDQPSVASTIDPRANSNWLSFGGGLQQRSSGVVDAFTAMKHEGQFYTIDGGTGTAVARQLQRGDKIRIGINGQHPPPDCRIKEYQQMHEPEVIDSSKNMTGHIVPLCWTDQIEREDTIVVQPSVPQQTASKKNLNETHPVVFKKFGFEGSRPPPSPVKEPITNRKTSVRVVEGYGVKRRTSARTNIDGSREKPTSRVTHISVNRRDDEANDLSYEEILDMRIKNKGIEGPLRHDELRTAETRLENSLANHDNKSSEASPKAKSSVRPMSTISSSGSPDFGGYIIGAVASHTNRHTTSPVNGDAAANVQNGRSTGRKKSGSARPPPLKPNLHKTAAASGSSIGSGRSSGSGKNTEYINMAQQMCITKEHALENTQNRSKFTPRSNFAAIRSVSEHNKPKEKDVTFKEQVEEIIPANFESQLPNETVKGNNLHKESVRLSPDVEIIQNPVQEQEDARSSVGSVGSDKQYAFNIPTAQHDSESNEMISTDRERIESAVKRETPVAQTPKEEQLVEGDVEQ